VQIGCRQFLFFALVQCSRYFEIKIKIVSPKAIGLYEFPPFGMYSSKKPNKLCIFCVASGSSMIFPISSVKMSVKPVSVDKYFRCFAPIPDGPGAVPSYRLSIMA